MINVEDILGKVDALPPLPGTSLRLINVISDPGSTVNDIVDVIKYDQALTARILRLCNSAYFGLSRNVSSLNEAMVCLGTVKILQLVMAIHTNSLLAEEQEGYDLRSGALWKHSVATAQAATHFAKRMKIENAGLVFTGALLHDIGKVVLSRYVAEEFAQIIDLVTTEKQSFVEAERAVLGFDHTEIGGMVAETWKLPDSLVRCIRYHHMPSEADVIDPLVDAVYLANCTCLLLGMGLGADGLCYRADEEVMTRSGLAENDLEAVGVAMLDDMQKLEAMFGEESSEAEKPLAAAK